MSDRQDARRFENDPRDEREREADGVVDDVDDEAYVRWLALLIPLRG